MSALCPVCPRLRMESHASEYQSRKPDAARARPQGRKGNRGEQDRPANRAPADRRLASLRAQRAQAPARTGGADHRVDPRVGLDHAGPHRRARFDHRRAWPGRSGEAHRHRNGAGDRRARLDRGAAPLPTRLYGDLQEREAANTDYRRSRGLARTKLQVERRIRDLAMFNLAIDSKLRGSDVVSLTVEDVAPNGVAIDRATVRQ